MCRFLPNTHMACSFVFLYATSKMHRFGLWSVYIGIASTMSLQKPLSASLEIQTHI